LPGKATKESMTGMARNWITLGEVAERIDMVDIRCGRCEPRWCMN
jgi:hypothetical protein